MNLFRLRIAVVSLISLPFIVYAANNAKEFASKNASGVVRIGVLYSATLTYPETIYNEKRDDYDPSQKQFSRPIQAVVSGSGFLVNPNGYIVTNAHVVDTNSKRVTDGPLWSEFQQEMYDNISKTIQDNDGTQDDINNYYDKIIKYVVRYGQWGEATHQITVLNPDTKYDTFSDYITHGYIAEIKKVGEPYPYFGKDIALIKIEPNQKFHPVTLGDSTQLTLGSNVYVMGYPGVSDISQDSINKPTITSGIISSIKKADTGDYNLIQIDAAVSAGNSGGPIFDGRGNVVGIATLKTEGADSYNFILPVELAKEYLSELNVSVITAQPSIVTLTLNQWAIILGLLFIFVIPFILKYKSARLNSLK